jgi:hypothetical protein
MNSDGAEGCCDPLVGLCNDFRMSDKASALFQAARLWERTSMARRVPLPGSLDDLKRRGSRRIFQAEGLAYAKPQWVASG